MQWLTLVPEDAGIQNLKTANRRPVITRSVDAVLPCPPAQAPRIGDGTTQNKRRQRERRNDERRAGEDRRKQQVPVLLDTRSKHDRRAIGNRRANASLDIHADQPPPCKHLNLYA